MSVIVRVKKDQQPILKNYLPNSDDVVASTLKDSQNFLLQSNPKTKSS